MSDAWLCAYKERVINEHSELDGSLSRLSEFMESERFLSLSHEDRFDMDRQRVMMFGYLQCLKSRISRF